MDRSTRPSVLKLQRTAKNKEDLVEPVLAPRPPRWLSPHVDYSFKVIMMKMWILISGRLNPSISCS